MLAPLVPFALFMAMFMFMVLMASERRIESETLAARQSEQIAAAAQLLAEARLRALQAQIEPHFLYNTLANVLGLIDTQPAQARHMLERFIDFLRASLAASRAEHATLGAELDLAAAYLDVLAVRLGRAAALSDRGADSGAGDPHRADAAAADRRKRRHARTRTEGRRRRDRAARARRCERLVIEVADSGAGLSDKPPRPGGGMGWPTCRARLRSLYGAGAQVQLLENQPCGMTVRVLLPLDMVTPSTNPTALIADDEPHLRDYLAAQLASAWPELRIVDKAANGIDALRLVDELAPDIVFLDIQMPGMTGLDVAARLAASEHGPHIVFVTAHDHYAVAAFEHSACDYLLKPATPGAADAHRRQAQGGAARASRPAKPRRCARCCKSWVSRRRRPRRRCNGSAPRTGARRG